ncbi:hypothetical protein ABS642_10450 [Microbacterium sp. A8/3-1]|uniref:Swt1-like HEPN domain-containing protein n=1 Tax=Microbacterium sp. A8/3-1 TaxID=3160749 RepID=A0AAU7W3E3_9MICO
MTAVDYSSWVEVVHRRARQFGLVFLQLGSSNEPARRALLNSPAVAMTAREYLDESHSADSVATVVLDGMESMAIPDSSIPMGVLRERVLRDVDEGTRIVLLSRAPRVAFPPAVGSQLLDDASLVHAPPIEGSTVEQWPTCADDGIPPGEVLRRTVAELGIDVCASLDRVIYESSLTGDHALNSLSARELEALDGAGVTVAEGMTRKWNFPQHLVPLRKALDEALADALEPQRQLAEVSAGLWKIERSIRQVIRRRALAAWATNWRSQCLNGDLRTKVLERATDSAYLGATTIKQLRDPLEWLSLGELLQLRDRAEIGALGLSPAHWRQFGVQVVPIRNRLAHMRNLRPEDATEIIKWQRILDLKLSAD